MGYVFDKSKKRRPSKKRNVNSESERMGMMAQAMAEQDARRQAPFGADAGGGVDVEAAGEHRDVAAAAAAEFAEDGRPARGADDDIDAVQAGAAVDGDDGGDEDEPEPPNPLVAAMELVRAADGRIVAYRYHFFFNSRRSDLPQLVYERLSRYEATRAYIRSNKRKMESFAATRGSIDQLRFDDYYTLASLYSVAKAPLVARQQASTGLDHPVKNPLGPYYPYNVFDVRTALRRVKAYNGHSDYGTLERYHLPEDLGGGYSFPRPEDVYLMKNTDVDVSVFFRLMWPHCCVSPVSVVSDPKIRALAAIEHGVHVNADELNAMDEEQKQEMYKARYEDMKLVEMGVKDPSFKCEAQLRSHMEGKLSAIKISYEAKRAKAQAAVDRGEADPSVLKQLFEEYCDETDKVGLEGVDIFEKMIWTEHSNISMGKKAVVRWMNAHLANIDLTKGEDVIFAHERINFSMPVPKLSANLTAFGDVVWQYTSLLETGFNIIHMFKHIISMQFGLNGVYSDDPFNANYLMSSEPGQGKSVAGNTVRDIAIPGTMHALDSFTANSLLASEGMFDNQGILIDELPANRVGSVNPNGRPGSNTNASTGDDWEAVLKRAIVQGELTKTLRMPGAKNGEFKTVTIHTKINTFWCANTNDPFSIFFAPVRDRFHCEVVVKNAVSEREEMMMRVALDRRTDKTFAKVLERARSRFRRDQAFCAMVYTMASCGIPGMEPYTAAASTFIYSVWCKLTGTCDQLGDSRAQKRIVKLATVACLVHTAYVSLDSDISVCKDKPWSMRHIYHGRALFVVDFNHVCFALGLCSGAHENEVMRVLVSTIASSMLRMNANRLQGGSTRPQQTHVQKREERKDQQETDEDADEIAKARRIFEKAAADVARQRAIFAAQDPAAAAAHISADMDLEGPRRSTHHPPGSAAAPVSKKEGRKMEQSKLNLAPLRGVGTGSSSSSSSGGVRSVDFTLPPILDASHPVYLTIRIDALSLQNANFGKAPYNPAVSRASVASDDGFTDYSQLQALKELVIRTGKMRGLHPSDIMDNIKALNQKKKVRSPIEGDMKLYPALVISDDGTLMIAKSIVESYTGKSVMKMAVKRTLEQMVGEPCTFVYGRTHDNMPKVWHTIRVAPMLWTRLTPEQLAQHRDELVLVRNAFHRSDADIRVSQRVIDAVSKYENSEPLDLSSVYDKDPGIICNPGSLEAYAMVRHMELNGIGMKQLKEMGMSMVPFPVTLNRVILAERVQNIANSGEGDPCKLLDMYPHVYGGTSLVESGEKQKRELFERLLKREDGMAGAVVMQSAERLGLVCDDVSLTIPREENRERFDVTRQCVRDVLESNEHLKAVLEMQERMNSGYDSDGNPIADGEDEEDSDSEETESVGNSVPATPHRVPVSAPEGKAEVTGVASRVGEDVGDDVDPDDAIAAEMDEMTLQAEEAGYDV